jgi:voltage-gated potassium channel
MGGAEVLLPCWSGDGHNESRVSLWYARVENEMTSQPESAPPPEPHPDRVHLHTIIFGHETPAGKAFDVILIALIFTSVVAVSLETLAGLPPLAKRSLRVLEWVLTISFTIEYVLRLLAVRRPAAYAGSFFGVVDLLAILPTYVRLVVPGAQTLLVVRLLRLLRVFRVLKLSRYLREARTLGRALRASARKIAVFLLVVGSLVVVIGSLMYVVEGAEHGFTSLPTSMYWTIVSLTTVGYGDIAPQTPLGQFLASLVMILGYGIIAVPTGIVTVELAQTEAAEAREREAAAHAGGDHTRPCAQCGARGHAPDALFCRRCGTRL